MILQSIGTFHGPQLYPYEAPRQGCLKTNDHEMAFVELLSGHNFHQALKDLESFSHLWLIYEFHHNQHWKPLVRPPRGGIQKRGVFATRSPYRPNPLGLSCVRLRQVVGLKIFIEDYDLLDGTPILDIKPYLAYADSFPAASLGWLPEPDNDYVVQFSSHAEQQLQFLSKHGVNQLKNFIIYQLQSQPLNRKKKRVKDDPRHPNRYVLAYRTWRIGFEIHAQQIEILKIYSGYSNKELLAAQDQYQDKAVHRDFNRQFSAVASELSDSNGGDQLSNQQTDHRHDFDQNGNAGT